MDKKPSNTQDTEVRKGPWTMEQDHIVINYIANHGEGVWNSLAKAAGLKRTGKSCRPSWLNYLMPDVRNITTEEQLLIMELHSKWGNRLDGQRDKELWRTRIQKHVRQNDPHHQSFPMQHTLSDHLSIHNHHHASTSSSGHLSCLTDHPMQDAYYLQSSFQPNQVIDPGFPIVNLSMEPTNEAGFWGMEELWSMQLLNVD